MLALGVFGGKYMTDARAEFPKSWFARAKLSPQSDRDDLNCFGVDASQPLSVWRKNGWIHRDDPRGWFQWYCRYYMGRRLPDEDRRPDQALEGDAAATSHKFETTATKAISRAAADSVKLFSTGPTTRARSEGLSARSAPRTPSSARSSDW